MPHLGIDAAREAAKKKVQDIHFEPKKTKLTEPKEGEHDDKPHSGGNKWAGGVSSKTDSCIITLLMRMGFPRLEAATLQVWEVAEATNAFTKEATSSRCVWREDIHDEKLLMPI